MILSHLLEHLDEKANLNLSCLLQEGIQSGGAFSLAQDTEPLLDGTELVLEVLVQSSSSHLFQRRFVLINVGNPLLGNLVLRVRFGVVGAKVLLSLPIEIGGRSNAAGGGRAS